MNLRDNRGSVLVAILFLAGLLTVLASVAASVLYAAVDSSRVFAENVRAKEAMTAAIEQIVGYTGSNLQEIRGTAIVRVSSAEVMIAVKDEGGRIDLNQAPAPLLSGIFRAVGVDQKAADSYAARIVDWRDPDDKTSQNGGAEKDVYRAAGRVDGPRNGPFLHVGELALVMGIPAKAAAAVAPYVTVASGRETINPMVADPPVLLALPGATPDRVQSFLAERIRPGAIAERLISRLGSVQDFVGEDTGDAVRFEGRVILAPGNERRFEVVAAVVGGDTEPYRILSWDSNPPDRIRAP